MDFNKTYLADQRNKQHKQNTKLEKKRFNEKERKIKKKMKKAERSQNTVKYHKDFKDSIKGVNFHKLKRQVDIFQEKFPHEAQDLVDILGFIDEGKKIDINDVENVESKILIENIFEILGLENRNLVYSKGKVSFVCKDAILMTMKKQSTDCNQQNDIDD